MVMGLQEEGESNGDSIGVFGIDGVDLQGEWDLNLPRR